MVLTYTLVRLLERVDRYQDLFGNGNHGGSLSLCNRAKQKVLLLHLQNGDELLSVIETPPRPGFGSSMDFGGS